MTVDLTAVRRFPSGKIEYIGFHQAVNVLIGSHQANFSLNFKQIRIINMIAQSWLLEKNLIFWYIKYVKMTNIHI